MKKTLLVGFYCGLAISLGGGSGAAHAAHAMLVKPDFTQLERLTELRPCKRMEKEFKPILSEIEKERQKTGVGTRLLWVDLYNTGYCAALPVPLTELGKLLLERFPKEIPFGFRAVNWNTVQQDIDWSLPYKSGGASLLDNVWSLITLYYDKKNKCLYWIEYRFEYGFRFWKVSKQGGLEETYTIQLGKAHYRNLLDDLAVMAKAKQRDRALVSQVNSMRRYLTGYANEHKEYSYGSELLEFLKAEHQRRGELMNFLEEEIKAFNEDKSVSAWTKAMTKLSEQIRAWEQARGQARNEDTDFSQLERVSAQHKPCKRMDKAFQPAFRKIEEERRKEGIEAPSQVLWFDDYYFTGDDTTGYCVAVSYPLVDDIPLILKHFPKEFPVGGRFVRWDSVRRETESDTLGSPARARVGSDPMEGWKDVERRGIDSLRTAYYDRKNKTYHWMEYRLLEMTVDQYPLPNDYEFLFGSTSVPFLELHYRTLLDDLAETAEAGPRRNLLTLQLLQLQAYLRESFKDTAFLEAERKRRGSLMRILDSARIEDLAEEQWTFPDVCTEGERWWPCHKAKEE